MKISEGGRRWGLAGMILLVVSSGVAVADGTPPKTARRALQEAAYLSENDVAMTRMMDGMAARPSGDIDRDFVAMMVPHHQGAIDMAMSYLRYGANEQLRRIAQEIIIDQQQEITAMKLAIGEPLPAAMPAPTQPVPEASSAPSAHDMNPNMKM
jgi:hypothetical protein